MQLVIYDSNNSGGGWWLSDENWQALEQAGWKVFWHRDDPDEKFAHADSDGRWLGGLARSAAVVRPTFREALSEFAAVAEQDPYAEGCNCCGSPHSFQAGEAPEGFDVQVMAREYDTPEKWAYEYVDPAYDLTGSRPTREPDF